MASHIGAALRIPHPHLPPGPTAEPLFQVLRWGRYPIEFMEECAERYGDTFTIRLATTPPLVFFSHPDAVRDILTGDEDRFIGGQVNALMAPVLGEHSLLVLDGARHRHVRRLMLPPFHGDRMHRYGDAIQRTTAEAIAGWPIGTPFPIHARMQGITLDIILTILFGAARGPLPAALRALLAEVVELASRPFMRTPALRAEPGRLKPWGRIVALRGELDRLLHAEIARRRGFGWPGGDDFLDLLIEATDETGRPLTAAHICDELVTLLASGHEATAASLAWVLHELLAHPEVKTRLDAELDDARRDGPLTPERAARLEYLDAVVKEALRLHPVFVVAGRGLVQPTVIGGYDLPAGVVVTPCIYLTHRRPDVWPEPTRFDPDRWRDLHPSPYQFLPFGGGMRRCLGMAFAVYEMKIILAEIVTRATVRPAAEAPVRMIRRNVALAPAGGVPVVLDARR